MDLMTAAWIQLLLFLVFFLGLGVAFLLTQFHLLLAIRPGNRKIPPSQVWLQIIPFLGLIYQFVVIKRISESISAELSMPVDDSIFTEEEMGMGGKPTYRLGMAYATLFCLTILPLELFKAIFALTGLVLWILYWIQINRYRLQFRQQK